MNLLGDPIPDKAGLQRLGEASVPDKNSSTAFVHSAVEVASPPS
jgi:hypothetical protein